MALFHQPRIRSAECRAVDCHAVVQGAVVVEEHGAAYGDAAHSLNGALGPQRIFEHRARHAYQVGLALFKQALGTFRSTDAAGEDNRDANRITDRRRLFAEVALFFGAGAAITADAARDIQQVHPGSFQDLRRSNGVFHGRATLMVITGAQTNGDGVIGPNLLANRSDNLAVQAHATFDGCAGILVDALVGERRVELAKQVAVGRMDFHPVEAGFLGAAGGSRESGDYLVDLFLGHGTRLHRFATGGGVGHGRRGRGEGRAVQGADSLAARMVHLGDHLGTVAMNSLGELRQPGNVFIVREGDLMHAGLSLFADIAVLGYHQAEVAALGLLVVVAEQRLAYLPLPFRFLGGHRRHNQAVSQGKGTNGQRLQQLRHGSS